LIVVLLISLAGMSILGGTMYMFNAFASSARVSVDEGDIYNVLQTEVEFAKAALRQNMRNTAEPPHWTPPGPINSVEDLSIGVGAKSGVQKSFGTRGGTLSVRIYDMQYAQSDLNPALTDEQIAQLPPPLFFVGGSGGSLDGADPTDPDGAEGSTGPGGPAASDNGGVYLIRATIRFDDGEEKTIETAIVQAIGG
jgi:hypothetical protein